jgi:hypothetical protein
LSGAGRRWLTALDDLGRTSITRGGVGLLERISGKPDNLAIRLGLIESILIFCQHRQNYQAARKCDCSEWTRTIFAARLQFHAWRRPTPDDDDKSAAVARRNHNTRRCACVCVYIQACCVEIYSQHKDCLRHN